MNYTLANEKTLNFGSIFHQIISKVLTDFKDGFNFALELKELSKITLEDYLNVVLFKELSNSKELSFVFDDYETFTQKKKF